MEQISAKGLNYDHARQRVKAAFYESLQDKQWEHCCISPVTILRKNYLALIAVAAYIVCVSFHLSLPFSSGLLLSVSVLAAEIVLNSMLEYLYSKTESNGAIQHLEKIVLEYELNCSFSKNLSNANVNELNVGKDIKIPSGYSQVSIINTFRQGSWIKLPLLLLAEGDVIALMGGDVTPGNVHELIPVMPSDTKQSLEAEDSNPEAHATYAHHHKHSHDMHWQRGKLLRGGEKVHIRRHAEADADMSPSEIRHRSVGAESLELLRLTGDTRCFEMAETPIGAFVDSILENANKAKRPTLIRQIFVLARTEGNRILAVMLALYIICAIIRLSLLPEARMYWILSVLIPFTTVIVLFSHVMFPLLLIALEALAMADVLASTEIVLNNKFQAHTARSFMKSVMVNLSGKGSGKEKSIGGRRGSNAASVMSDSTGMTQAAMERRDTRPRRASKVSSDGGTIRQDGAEDRDEEELDENDQFHDEDIDDRADEVDEEIATKFSLVRYVLYVWAVLKDRLGDGTATALHSEVQKLREANSTLRSSGNEGNGYTTVPQQDPQQQANFPAIAHCLRNPYQLLPIPSASQHLLELLGAITMVCFVDDDIICENYSVTEEIFLLMDGNRHFEEQQAKNKSKTSQNQLGGNLPAKGIVLDLHANPQASGSRFENPMWWRYLNSLKPIGLNSLLTYRATSMLLKHEEMNHHLVIRSEKHASLESRSYNNTLSSQSRTHLSGESNHSSGNTLPFPEKVNGESLPPISAQNTILSIATSAAALKGGSEMKNAIEKKLIKHVRETLPLESLRELSEEIGFLDQDVQDFVQVLEVNVIAPGLENSHLLEDTHCWGQEESRRRGALIPQIRSAVFQDGRGGGMQMMSLGDPSLLLNYCREYWDGSSITPISAADRKEVLTVYDRWRLEDFDVVAFSYSPIPTQILQPLTDQAVMQVALETGLSRSRTDPSSRPTSLHLSVTNTVGDMSHGEFLQRNSIFFVDPTSSQSLATGVGSRAATKQDRASTVKFAAEHKHHVHEHHHHEEEEEHGEQQDTIKGVAFSPPDRKGTSLSDMTKELSEADLLLAASNTFSDNQSPFQKHISMQSAASSLLESEFALRESEEKSDGAAGASKEAMVRFEHAQANPHAASLSGPAVDRLVIAGDEQDILSVSETADEVSQFGGSEKPGTSTVFPPRRASSDSNLRKRGLSSRKSEMLDYIMMTENESSVGEDELPPTIDAPTLTSEEQTSENPNDFSFQDTDLLIDHMNQQTEHLLMDGEHEHLDLDVAESEQGDKVSAPGTPPKSSPRAASSMSYSSPRTELLRSQHSTPKTPITPRASGGGIIKSVSLDGGLDTIGVADSEESHAGNALTKSDTLIDDHPSLHSLTVELQQERMDGGMDLPDVKKVSAGRSVTLQPSLRPSQLNLKMSRPTDDDDEAGKAFTKSSTEPANFHRIQYEPSSKRSSSRQSHMLPSTRATKKASMRHLWSLMRQQVFLGMAASSVPVRPEVPSTMEDLSSAGIRFVYFSPRNMKRSKPVAEKIGIAFDWNCAISLRELGDGKQDPHRHISTYADWDVLARMPHGIEAIKEHLLTVDNVPLLVSLFTDATPETTKSMVDIFRENGEIVLTVGSGYRIRNHTIYQTSDISTSVSTLPGVLDQLPSHANDLIDKFPENGANNLCRADIRLALQLVGLGTVDLLQTPYLSSSLSKAADYATAGDAATDSVRVDVTPTDKSAEQMKLAALMESVYKGRILLLNSMQAIGIFCVATVALALWPIVANAVPISIPPYQPPAIQLLFLFVYLPILAITTVLSASPDSVMKNTPRKNTLTRKPRDESRFYSYLAVCSTFIAFSIFLVGWFTAGSTLKTGQQSVYDGMAEFHRMFEQKSFTNAVGKDLQAFWLIQDMMANEAFLCLLALTATMQTRGQTSVLDLQPELLIAFAALGGIHALVMGLRDGLRQCSLSPSDTSYNTYPMCHGGKTGAEAHTYANLDWIVWVVMVVLPVLGMALVLGINSHDSKSYRRYLQFLRLEFDTRLGMHSPR